MDDQAAGLRCIEALPCVVLCLRRTVVADGARQMGWRQVDVAPDAGSARLHRDQCGQPRQPFSTMSGMAQNHLPEDGNCECRGSGWCSESHQEMAVCRPGADRRLGLERRWFLDSLPDVSLSGLIQAREC